MDIKPAIQPKKRIAPIQVTAADIENTLRLFGKNLDFKDNTIIWVSSDREPVTIKKLREFFNGLAFKAPEYILNSGELHALCTLLFSSFPPKKSLTYVAITDLKDATGLNILEEICRTHQHLTKQEILGIICLYPQHTEITVPQLQYSHLTTVLPQLNTMGLLDEKSYITIIQNAKYIGQLNAIFVCLKEIGKFNTETCSLICQNLDHFFSVFSCALVNLSYLFLSANIPQIKYLQLCENLENFFLICGYLKKYAYTKESCIFILEHPEHVEHIAAAFSALGKPAIQDEYIHLSICSDKITCILLIFSLLEKFGLYIETNCLLIWKNAQHAKHIYLALSHLEELGKLNAETCSLICQNLNHIIPIFSYLNENGIYDKILYGKTCANIQNIFSIYSYLQKYDLYYKEYCHFVWKNIKYAEHIAVAFSHLDAEGIQDKDIYLFVCKNIESIYFIFSDLTKYNLYNEENCLNIWKKAQHSPQINLAFIGLEKLGKLNAETCSLICQNLDPITSMFSCLDEKDLYNNMLYSEICENIQNILSIYSYLQKYDLYYEKYCHLALINAKYAENIDIAFLHLDAEGIQDKDIYLSVCRNIESISFILFELKKFNLYNKKYCLLILKNPQQSLCFKDIILFLQQTEIYSKDILLKISSNFTYIATMLKLFNIFKKSSPDFYQNICIYIEHIDSIFSLYLNHVYQFDVGNYYFIGEICRYGKYAEQISPIFSRLISPPPNSTSTQNTLCEDIKKVILAFSSADIQYTSIFFTLFLAACIYGHTDVVNLLLETNGVDPSENSNCSLKAALKQGHLNIARLLLHDKRVNPATWYADTLLLKINENPSFPLQSVFLAFSRLEEAGVLCQTTAEAICQHSARAKKITEAFLHFHQARYFTKSLIDDICEHADDAKDIAPLFAYLRPTGLLTGLDGENNCKAIFEKSAYIKHLKPLFELMIKSDLFKSDDSYSIMLMNKLQDNITYKNIIIITQDPIMLCQFDENGHKKETFREGALQQALKGLKLDYLLIQEIDINETVCLNTELDFKKIPLIYDLLQSKGIQIQNLDHRKLNFNIILKGAKYAEDLLPLFHRLNGVGLIFQFTLMAAFGIRRYAKSVNLVFEFLNRLDILDKSNCQWIFQHAKFSNQLVTALVRLELEGNQVADLFTKKIVSAICEHPQHSENIVSICILLRKNNISLSNDILQLICNNAKYSASIFSACCILDAQLTKEIFISLCKDPKQAIPFAMKLAGKIENNDEPGVKEYQEIQKISQIIGETGGGCFSQNPLNDRVKYLENQTLFAYVPKEILLRVISNCGDKLDSETKAQILTEKLGHYSYLYLPQKPHEVMQKILPQSENHIVTYIECINKTMKIHFNSAQAAKFFYDTCYQHNNIYQWVYDSDSESQFILLKDLRQIQYLISDICKLDFDEFCKSNPELNFMPEKMPSPSSKR